MRSPKRLVFLSIGLALIFAAFASTASASSGIHVVHPGQSIQKAVDAAAAGETVVVKAGTYHEFVTIQKDGLTLRAQGAVTLRPPAAGSGICTDDEEIGICVVPADIDPATFTYTNRVRNVTITGFRVVGFEGDGVFGFGTKNLRVSGVKASRNTDYGIASFDGVGTKFIRNEASGSADTGIYIGDSPNANAVMEENRAWNNAANILVRESHHVLVSDNKSWGGCFGILLLHDGQASGSGDIAVLDNTVRANNKTDCPLWTDYLGVPAVGGGGIVLAGSQNNVIAHNVVLRNRGTSQFSGGIVLVATPLKNTDGSYSPSINNVVVRNKLRHNKPANIVHDAASTPNFIAHNH
jgi:hypothetical protein